MNDNYCTTTLYFYGDEFEIETLRSLIISSIYVASKTIEFDNSSLGNIAIKSGIDPYKVCCGGSVKYIGYTSLKDSRYGFEIVTETHGFPNVKMFSEIIKRNHFRISLLWFSYVNETNRIMTNDILHQYFPYRFIAIVKINDVKNIYLLEDENEETIYRFIDKNLRNGNIESVDSYINQLQLGVKWRRELNKNTIRVRQIEYKSQSN